MKKIITTLSILTIVLVMLSRCEKDDFSFYPKDNFYIADSSFLNALIEAGIDKNDDGKISFEEAEGVKVLNIHGRKITFLAGIEMFINLDTF